MTHLWQEMEGHAARIASDRFSLAIDAARPGAGLDDIVVDGQPLADFHPLAADLAAPTAANSACEHYLRGGDLVATYPDRPAPELRSQLYWRAGSHHRDGAIFAIELVASVQTALLDSCPQLVLRSRLLAAEAFQLVDPQAEGFSSIVPPRDDPDPDALGAPFCYLFRLAGRRYSYAEMVHPAAAQASSWDGWLHGTEYRLELAHKLFADRLEKGVILRSRVLGLLLDRRDDKAAVVRHWHAFLAAELPLTT